MRLTNLSLAIWASLIAIVIKLVVFQFFPGEEAENFPRFAYLLIITVLLFLSISSINSKEVSFLDQLKKGLMAGALFVLFISLFTYIYYEFIDPGYFENRISARVAEAEAKDYSEEQIRKVREDSEVIFSSVFHAPITLFLFTLYACLNAVIITFAVRVIRPS